MKKVLIMLVISALMLISAFAAENTVYVSDGGTGNGSTSSTPVGTLADAYAALGDEGGTIVIVDKYSFSTAFVEPKHSGKVTVTGGTLAATDTRYILNGDTTFENITIHGTKEYLLIVAQFNPVTLGEGVNVTGFGNFFSVANGLCIVGGVQSGADKYNDTSLINRDTNITVKSGKAIIIGFSRNVNTDFTGTSNINIEGGTLYNIYYGSVSGSGNNSNLTISGGTFIYNIYSNAKIGKLTGNINVKITGGDFSASTLKLFDGSVISEGATSVADLRGYNDYSKVVNKMENFTKIVTDDGEAEAKLPLNKAFLYGNFTASNGKTLPYRYYLPKDYETSGKDYPVFFYFHGAGSCGDDNEKHLAAYSINTAVYNSDYDCIMIAPHCPADGYAWTLHGSNGGDVVNQYPGTEGYADFLESGEPYGSKNFCAAVELLDMFLNEYRVDTSRVYLAGGSNGGGAVWNMLTLYPEMFAAAVPVAGSRAEKDYVHAIAHRMKDISIWAVHGDADTNVPPEGTRVIYAALQELGGDITYTEVEGGNHSNIWEIAADTPGLIDWLFAQTNDSFENTISQGKGEPLPAPANLSWDGETATWDAVENAGAYKVTFYVDGTVAKTVYTYSTSYTPDFDEFGYGKYTFTVRALPQKNLYSISAESTISGVYTDISKVADYNGDGAVTIADALMVINSVVNNTTIKNGDVNGDGKTNLADVHRIFKFITQ